jgi:lipopolysaccharide transport system ATP-binding protein
VTNQAVSAQGLSKLYRLGELQGSLGDSVRAGLRRLRGQGPATESSDFWALRDVSFDVAEGEVLGIIGRNGAGKSTLLKILSRLTEPTHGRVVVHGRVGSLLEVGTGFHPELTGRENIFLNGTIIGMRRNDILRRFDEIVEFAEIGPFLDTPVKRYSSGMYVRLAFAVAAHLEPDILIVDEVLAVGDLAFQRKCLGRIGETAGEGRTVLFVSHNMAAVKSLCSRVILLDHGEVVTDGGPDATIGAYVEATWPVRSDGTVVESDARIGTGAARLRRVAMKDLNDQPIDRLYLGQPFRISAFYEVHERLEDIAMEIGISTPDGVRIASMGNTDLGGPALTFEPGMQEITVDVDVTLLPHAQYVVDVAMHQLPGLTIDWVERATQFTALNIAEGSTDHYPWNVVRGYVRPSSIWTGPVSVRP